MAIWEVERRLSAHCVASDHCKDPCSISCMELPHAPLTACQGRDVASLRDKHLFSQSWILNMVYVS